MDQTITFVFTIIFLLESFWEVRLFSQLQLLATQKPANIPPRFVKVMRLERRWNWMSWILIILLFLTSSRFTILLVSLITLIETYVVWRMDNMKSNMIGE
ncbi:hypothetical protein EAI26_04190 [Lactobacillus sp. 0.1XD8-4]|uniref:Uncharacterized protein n=1 Tax=Limosilactobacillus walteri TaxID=2268022 RepID=A0ABR8P8Q9_9LACO|nr:hypothetical protein [Limosilactobacillus walteri]MBD5807077.1 hypothetical protein [Limosilactobacillus walteri]MRN06597.1 hypothetical protein [Lactobacillus sp. 0.1XD8-4]